MASSSHVVPGRMWRSEQAGHFLQSSEREVAMLGGSLRVEANARNRALTNEGLGLRMRVGRPSLWLHES